MTGTSPLRPRMAFLVLRFGESRKQTCLQPNSGVYSIETSEARPPPRGFATTSKLKTVSRKRQGESAGQEVSGTSPMRPRTGIGDFCHHPSVGVNVVGGIGRHPMQNTGNRPAVNPIVASSSSIRGAGCSLRKHDAGVYTMERSGAVAQMAGFSAIFPKICLPDP